jgi:hypothetical protein
MQNGGSSWQEGPGPIGEPYRPNEAFQRALNAKRILDQRMWGNG